MQTPEKAEAGSNSICFLVLLWCVRELGQLGGRVYSSLDAQRSHVVRTNKDRMCVAFSILLAIVFKPTTLKPLEALQSALPPALLIALKPF